MALSQTFVYQYLSIVSVRVYAHRPTYINLQHLFVSLSLCKKQEQHIASSMFDLEAPPRGRPVLLHPTDADNVTQVLPLYVALHHVKIQVI